MDESGFLHWDRLVLVFHVAPVTEKQNQTTFCLIFSSSFLSATASISHSASLLSMCKICHLSFHARLARQPLRFVSSRLLYLFITAFSVLRVTAENCPTSAGRGCCFVPQCDKLDNLPDPLALAFSGVLAVHVLIFTSTCPVIGEEPENRTHVGNPHPLMENVMKVIICKF